MKLIFTSYTSTPEYSQPELWLKRIEGYTGILESLSRNNKVIGIERINYEGEYVQNGVQYYFVKLKNKVVRFPLHIHRLIKRMQPDVVFVNGLIFPMQIIQLRLVLGKSVKIILLHRAERPFGRGKKYLQKLADKCVDAYLFTTSAFSNDWRRYIDVKKIHEVIQASSIFNTIDRTEAVKGTGIKGPLVFLWVGSLIPRKDPLTVVKAFLEFARYRPESKMYMIYQSAELLQEINTLLDGNKKYREAIVLVGKVSHDQLLYWYNSADFFISASRYEGSGVAVSEAMSCGCIPITSDFITFQKMTGSGKCGLLFETGNDKDLLVALLKTDEMDMEKERDRVLRQFKEELSFEAIAKKINAVIASL